MHTQHPFSLPLLCAALALLGAGQLEAGTIALGCALLLDGGGRGPWVAELLLQGRSPARQIQATRSRR